MHKDYFPNCLPNQPDFLIYETKWVIFIKSISGIKESALRAHLIVSIPIYGSTNSLRLLLNCENNKEQLFFGWDKTGLCLNESTEYQRSPKNFNSQYPIIIRQSLIELSPIL